MQTLVLAYQSLGVVYGDLGTSPVNVFSSTRLTKPLSEEDLLGTLSLIIWTLTFLVLIKYVFIVLNANDHGEGGTFALYSYIVRHLNFRSKFIVIHDTRSESGSSGGEGESKDLSTRTKKFLEGSSNAQNFLTILVLVGTCMVIGDGALTPATCGSILIIYISNFNTLNLAQFHIYFSIIINVYIVCSCFSPSRNSVQVIQSNTRY